MNLTLVQAIKLAKKHINSDRPEEARRIYEEILTQFPHNKAARVSLRKLLQSNGLKAVALSEPPSEKINRLMKGDVIQQAVQKQLSIARSGAEGGF